MGRDLGRLVVNIYLVQVECYSRHIRDEEDDDDGEEDESLAVVLVQLLLVGGRRVGTHHLTTLPGEPTKIHRQKMRRNLISGKRNDGEKETDSGVLRAAMNGD